MPHKVTGVDKPKGRSNVERARQYLSGGIARDDSDDELGLEDHPWEWVYAENVPDEEEQEQDQRRGKKKRGRVTNAQESQTIIGARMGTFECRLGDCVFLKAEGATSEAWVGIICDFEEDEEDEQKCANFMWFSTEKEIRNKQKKRTDAMQNELYITPSWDINPLASINGKASVVSQASLAAKYPSGRIPRSSRDYGKLFVCRRGCNTRTATYTDEFVWEDVYRGYNDLDSLVDRVRSQTKATRKRKRDKSYDDDDDDDEDAGIDEVENADGDPKTPRKKRKFQQASTPASKSAKRTPQKYVTPTHRRVIIKKALEFTPLGTRILSPNQTTSSPFQIARTTLHVSSVPDTLPCRNTEFSTVYSHLEAAISAGTGSCIYISGTPGTGKTATVREVIAQLNASVLAEELDDFIFVEINGMKVTDPHQAYSLLWEALRGERVSPTHALGLLQREFDHPSPRRVPCVVLMDELDQLVTKNQSVMYNFFNWPGLRHSRLIVLAVANTMDLPERTLSNKISSRLGLTRITFPGYTHDQLQLIIQSRLSLVPAHIVDPDAIQFASRKVAAVSGDARRALDICRRAVEIAESESSQNPLLNTPSKRKSQGRLIPSTKDGGERRDGKERSGHGKVTIATVKQAINEATSSPLQQYLKALPLASKLFLAALLARTRRTGVGECVLGDVLEEAKRLGRMAAENPAVEDVLLTDTMPAVLHHEGGSTDRRKVGSVARVLGLGIAAGELAAAGVVGVEAARRGERGGKLRLGIGDEEIRLALRDDGEVQGLGFGG